VSQSIYAILQCLGVATRSVLTRSNERKEEMAFPPFEVLS
jgi:hypothetical protein